MAALIIHCWQGIREHLALENNGLASSLKNSRAAVLPAREGGQSSPPARFAYFVATPRITEPALNSAVAESPSLSPRASTLSLVMLAAMESPPGS